MILESLVNHYEYLLRNDTSGDIPRRGWDSAKATFALDIDDEGNVISVIPVSEVNNGRSIPRVYIVPEHIKRGNNLKPYFLCDAPSYFLGQKVEQSKDEEGTEKAKAMLRLNESYQYHQGMFEGMDNPVAKAVVNYLAGMIAYDDYIENHPVLGAFAKDLISSSSIVLMYRGKCVHEYDEMINLWNNRVSDNKNIGRCLVTGELAPIARLHPVIRGVYGATPTGPSLVCFNNASEESWGNKQGDNSPVSEYAAFAYSAALNHLLSDFKHRHLSPDKGVTYVAWTDNDEDCYQALSESIFSYDIDKVTLGNKELEAILKSVAYGREIDFDMVNQQYDNTFYLLALSPNQGRISVRMFYKNSFGKTMENIAKHYKRLNLASGGLKQKYISVKRMLLATTKMETDMKAKIDLEKDKSLSGIYNGIIKSILFDYRYPSALLQRILYRIKMEQGEVTYTRAAVIRAYLLKNNKEEYSFMEESSLNNINSSESFALGRMFAVFEFVQLAANNFKPVNTSVKDKYFASAMTTPARIFPILVKLNAVHMPHLLDGKRIFCERIIVECMKNLKGGVFPVTLKIEDQGAFSVGYFLQKNELCGKKNKNTEEEPAA